MHNTFVLPEVTRGAYIMDPGFDYELLITFPLNQNIHSIFKKQTKQDSQAIETQCVLSRQWSCI